MCRAGPRSGRVGVQRADSLRAGGRKAAPQARADRQPERPRSVHVSD